MINNNKILTVSYGTFSCTLEGFDDSFGTMKAIAEYFRDLASEDRYFGAEPPQPDAEMLAHIAQREISRRVDAREQDGKIVLSARAHEEDAPKQTSQFASQAPVGSSAVSTSFAPRRPNEISAYYDAYRLNALKDLVPSKPAPAQAEPAHVEPEAPKVATEKDQEPVTLDARDDRVSEQVIDDDANASADAVSEPTAAIPSEAATEGESAEATEATEAVSPDAEAEAFFADTSAADHTVEEDAIEDMIPEAVVVEDQPEERAKAADQVISKPDSIAAKLQRIRAVVSRQEAAAADPDYTEDEHAEEKAPDQTDADSDVVAAYDKAAIIAEAVHDIEGAFEEDDAATVATLEDDEEDDSDIDAMLGRLDEEEDEDDKLGLDDVTEKERIASIDDGTSHTGPTPENLFDADSSDLDAPDAAIPDADAADAAPRGRVIKVKRADLEQAIAKGDLEEYSTEDATSKASKYDDAAKFEASTTAESTPSSLSDEEEDELARELAEVEAALAHDAPADVPMTEAAARRKLPELESNTGSDMNRLLAETDHQMDDPEGATRRNAITHLRAAVAAKKADVALGASDEDEDEDVYRNDLAEVVRPRRPVSSTSRTDRPTDARPAPLKLVAEQRIDTDATKTITPVRPRRVASVSSPVSAVASPSAGGFAEFASEMGAVKLNELLEAAAAYMSFVEGLDQFSRPQLMNTVRQVEKEDFSREDGLRSFGQLLRTGKIRKLDGGRFKASENIGYQPDTRAAG